MALLIGIAGLFIGIVALLLMIYFQVKTDDRNKEQTFEIRQTPKITKDEKFYYKIGHEPWSFTTETSMKELSEFAKKGNKEAQFVLGFCHQNGVGTGRNINEALKWYRKAVKQEFAPAQTQLGSCYDDGYGVKQDANEAFKLYNKAAEQGHALGQNALAWCYCNGNGVGTDTDKAALWWGKAASQGLELAQVNLGNYYAYGWRWDTRNKIEKDMNKAIEWWTKAADKGNYEARVQLAVCYTHGEGCDRDLLKAWKYIEQFLPAQEVFYMMNEILILDKVLNHIPKGN